MVLIVSWPEDDHAVAVVTELAHAGVQATLLDLSRFPQNVALHLHYNPPRNRSFRLRLADQTDLPLECCRVVWWRRPQPFALHPEIASGRHSGFAYNECMEAVLGMWLALDAVWVNHPSRDEAAARKLYQLRTAQDVGLTIPRTLVTNDPAEARTFIDAYGHAGTVYKAFAQTQDDWRETRVLRADELSVLDSVRYAPVIFQEYVPAQYDLRITVAGHDLFPAAVYSQQTSYPVDYRMDMGNARVEAVTLPSDVDSQLRALLDQLGLVYGAIDMRLTPEGTYVFLEVNPSGQWLFIEERTHQPITASFARLLAACDAGR